MAAGAFSDPEIADYLNSHFVAIKIDREQRPDIDRYLMAFLVATTGQGGWPMNVFLSPDGLGEGALPRPFFAMTYAAVEPRYGMPGFLEILTRIDRFFEENRSRIEPFDAAVTAAVDASQADAPASFAEPSSSPAGAANSFSFEPTQPAAGLVDRIDAAFDERWGGFGPGPKFPPHCTLLFLTYLSACAAGAATSDQRVERCIRTTLDIMQQRGLHDHLQGGFFRYCVDTEWTIPHFEKMLYDQALLLWNYSAAYARFGDESYRSTAVGIIRCLRDTFLDGELFVSAHDADTEHQEGLTYLFGMEELRRLLTPGELSQLEEIFELSDQGNFEGKNHLIRRSTDHSADEVTEKLLRIRRARPQPHTDRKIVTSWNCLAAVALIMAHRYLGMPDALRMAKSVLYALLRRHFRGGVLHHSSMNGELQTEQFLEDEAAMLLLLTTIHQETGEAGEEIAVFRRRVERYRTGGHWMESNNADFVPVRAERYDHPSPSSPALAERALLEAAIVSGEVYYPRSFGIPLAEDFGNLTTLVQNGWFYTVETPDPIPWSALPINALQFPGPHLTTCRLGVCTPGLVLPQRQPPSAG